ncbi:MAG: hypothetical protein JRG90_20335 [Deltaproteobacteria bacterium]|nr:hypothetical protein [Deltaproteobacteria bacterium]MBW2664841.1 hypothetical protein [Deltaproteobacteria bacterium]
MFDRIMVAVMVMSLAMGLGCASTLADPTGRYNSLEEAQRRYTELIRWGEIKRASQYVEPELRDEFVSYALVFEQIRITDTNTDEVRLDPGETTASVDVIYHGYSNTTFIEKRIFETQQWTRHDGLKNVWLVKPEIEQIAAAFVGKRH